MENTGMGVEHLELGDIDEYTQDVLEHANNAALLWFDEKFEEAREPIFMAAKARYEYALGRYAWIIYNDIFYLEKWHTNEHLFHMTDCFLMGAIRGEEWESSHLLLYANETEEGLNLNLNSIPTLCIYKWLRGEYGPWTEHRYPEEIQKIIQLYIKKFNEFDVKRNINRKRMQIEQISSDLTEDEYMKKVEEVVKRYKSETHDCTKNISKKAVRKQRKIK